MQDAGPSAILLRRSRTTKIDRHQRNVRATELAAAVAFRYGLGKLLARAVDAATRTEDNSSVPRLRDLR